MPLSPADLVSQALCTTSIGGVEELWNAVERAGARHRRPVGDRWGNRGLFTAAGGTVDHKLIELATNMHDAVVASAMARHSGLDAARDSDYATIFDSPSAAVDALFSDSTRADLARQARVELHLAGGEGEHRRRRSVVFRDYGSGMTPSELPGALFRVGSSRKDGVLWQQGAFGRGGLTVLPSCAAWVVVTRKQPDLLSAGEADQVTIAVVRWVRVGNRQTDTALYQVIEAWENEGDPALPLSVPASECEFPAGTHLCVVAFEAEGIWVSRLGDERSLDTLLDTRLYEPPLPLSLTTPGFGARGSRTTVLRGLGRRLEDNPRGDRVEGREELPLVHDGTTYRLPIRYFLFPVGDLGARRRFVARDHALIWNSNGQVHAHWTPAEFRNKTRLPKLADRILVVVETDELPLPLRTSLFTADRTELLRNADAVRLEAELVAFLDDWDELWRANNDLIRDAIRRSNSDRTSRGVARRIARAIRVRGGGGRAAVLDPDSRRPEPRVAAPRVLRDEPTTIAGPREVTAPRGRTKGVYVSIDGVDDFIPRVTDAQVTCGHLDIDPDSDVTVGRLRGGRLRVAIAVPPDAEPTEAELTIRIPAWAARSGGSNGPLEHVTRFRVVDGAQPEPSPSSSPSKSGAVIPDDRVALLWSSHEQEADWTPRTVGELELVDADTLAQAVPDYASLAGHHFEVSVVKLNEDFGPLKSYASLRAKEIGDEGVARAKDRYAVGVGVEMLVLDEHAREMDRRHEVVDEGWLDAAQVAAARGVLAVLPDYDQLVAEARLEGV